MHIKCTGHAHAQIAITYYYYLTRSCTDCYYLLKQVYAPLTKTNGQHTGWRTDVQDSYTGCSQPRQSCVTLFNMENYEPNRLTKNTPEETLLQRTCNPL